MPLWRLWYGHSLSTAGSKFWSGCRVRQLVRQASLEKEEVM